MSEHGNDNDKPEQTEDSVQQERDKHKERMKKHKEKVDERIAQAQEERGILIVLTGNGKGKSTSGFGTVTRAVGHGMKAAVVQYVKGTWPCGERDLLQQCGVPFHVMGTGFTWETQDKDTDIKAAQAAWEQSKVWLTDPTIDLVLLDEITYMVSYKYLDLNDVLTTLQQRPKDQTVVITGRSCHRDIIEIADTVSEVRSVKHAFDNGIKAQQGIDW